MRLKRQQMLEQEAVLHSQVKVFSSTFLQLSMAHRTHSTLPALQDTL